MPAQNKDIVRRVAEGLWNHKNFDLIDQDFHPDYRDKNLGTQEVKDLRGFRANVEMLLTAFPDMHVQIVDMIAEGDSVAKIWKLNATFKADYMGIPPNNKQILVSGITIYRIMNGKIKECVWGYDQLGMMQQMGAIPAEAPATA